MLSTKSQFQGGVDTSCLQVLLKICASLRWPGHLNGDKGGG